MKLALGAWAGRTVALAMVLQGYSGLAQAPVAANQADELAAPVIKPAGGEFAGPVEVSIVSPASKAVVRYTLDGSDPGENSLEYDSGHLRLSGSATLRARVFPSGRAPSPVATAKFVVANHELLTSLPVGKVQLYGRLGDRHGKNVTYLLYLHDENQPWIKSYDGTNQSGPGVPMTKLGKDFMLDFFRDRATANPQGWEGEYAGKWLDAAAGMVANGNQTYSGLADLAAKATAFAEEFRATQAADGYASIEPPASRYGPWDLWNAWYFLHANLNQYEGQAVPAALEAAARNGKFIWQNYQPVGGNAILGGAWDGATTDILDQLVRLYRHTGNTRYLDMGAYISANFARVTKMRASGTLLIEASHAYVVSAYLAGMVNYDQASGNFADLAWLKSVWQDIVDHHLFPEFGVGQGETFVQPAEYNDGGGRETCSTMEWLNFTNHLYEATGDLRYAHQLEHTVYNALLAAQSVDGLKWCYYTPSRRDGGKEWLIPPLYFGSVNCCFYSGPRAIARLPGYLYRLDPEGVRVDFYEASSATVEVKGRAIAIAQDTSYPGDGKVFLTLDPVAPIAFQLKLRLPEWARQIALKVNDQEFSTPLVPGSYAVIERTWQAGDTVDLQFELATTLRRNPAMTGIVGAAIQRGPEVLALDARDNPKLDFTQVSFYAAPILTPMLPTPDGRYLYRCLALVGGSPQSVILTPLADAGNDGASYRAICPVSTQLPPPP